MSRQPNDNIISFIDSHRGPISSTPTKIDSASKNGVADVFSTWTLLELRIDQAYYDRNAMNSGKSIVPKSPFDVASICASIDTIIIVLITVVELSHRESEN